MAKKRRRAFWPQRKPVAKEQPAFSFVYAVDERGQVHRLPGDSTAARQALARQLKA